MIITTTENIHHSHPLYLFIDSWSPTILCTIRWNHSYPLHLVLHISFPASINPNIYQIVLHFPTLHRPTRKHAMVELMWLWISHLLVMQCWDLTVIPMKINRRSNLNITHISVSNNEIDFVVQGLPLKMCHICNCTKIRTNLVQQVINFQSQLKVKWSPGK